jgi:hypothetical protein
MHLRALSFPAAVVAASLAIVACSSSSDRAGFGETQPNPDPGNTSGSSSGDFSKTPPPPPPPAPEIAEVYGHSADTLYKLDPKTKAVTTVGKFTGASQIIDIALDAKSNLYGTSFNALYLIDKKTADCKQLSTGSYPNSLSFVPAGTVDPAEEALVGYEGADYVRIDVHNGGAKTKIGSLGSGGFISSGDIVSVKGGKTYLTVKGGTCNASDCLVEVDPATGKMTNNLGSIGHNSVFGLSFWAGTVYGFDETGNLFEVEITAGALKTKAIPIPSAPSGLSFWGAGSTTSAPLVAQPQ